MKRICLLLLFGSIGVVNSQTCNNLFPSVSADGNHLYFSSNRHGGNYEIYKSDLDGSTNLQRLTFTSVNNYYAIENKQGTKVVWQSGDYTNGDVWIMNTNGANQVNLTNSPGIHDGYPNFSPDGQTIVFEGWDSDPYPEVFTMGSDGTNRMQLTSLGGYSWQCNPAYNPSGTYIYFSQGFNADNHLVRMDLSGNNWVDITPLNVEASGIAEGGLRFSPDGTKIVFFTTDYAVSGGGSGTDVIIADTTGANWNKITNSTGGANYYYPYWHPTADKIYHSFNVDGVSSWSLREMSSQGTMVEELSSCYQVGFSEEVLMDGQILVVYPNPASLIVQVEIDEDDYVRFYDCSGVLVKESAYEQIDISDLSQGIYHIHVHSVSNDQLMRTAKLVVQ